MNKPTHPAKAKAILSALLDAEAADSRIEEPAFRLGYLLSFVSDFATPAILAEAQRRTLKLNTTVGREMGRSLAAELPPSAAR